MKKILTLFIFIIISFSSNAQQIDLGIWGGTANYFGDINNEYGFNRIRPAGGLFVRNNFNTRLAAKFGFNYGNVGYSDSYSSNDYQKLRNLSFYTDIYEVALTFEFNFLDYSHVSRSDYYTPYLFFGISGYKFNPKTKYNDEVYALQPLKNENVDYSLIQLALPFGGGFKWDLAPQWSINVDVGMRFLFTDYFDDVSTIYINPRSVIGSEQPNLTSILYDRSDEVTDRPIGIEGKQRGDSKQRDSYAFMGISITYNLINVKCYKF